MTNTVFVIHPTRFGPLGNSKPAATVAAVTTDLEGDAALEEAWRLTNSVDTNWSKAPAEGVTVLLDLEEIHGHVYGHRSSMVGDVFILTDGCEFTVHRAAALGFKELDAYMGTLASKLTGTNFAATARRLAAEKS